MNTDSFNRILFKTDKYGKDAIIGDFTFKGAMIGFDDFKVDCVKVGFNLYKDINDSKNSQRYHTSNSNIYFRAFRLGIGISFLIYFKSGIFCYGYDRKDLQFLADVIGAELIHKTDNDYFKVCAINLKRKKMVKITDSLILKAKIKLMI
jgi:hypothetical protein